MTDAPLGSITSGDGKSWSAFKNIVNGYSDFGMAMTVYRGELWGIMTQTVQYPGVMFVNKYTPGSGWSNSWITLNEFAKAVGRVSIAVLNDRVFLLHRAPSDNGIYLGYTFNMRTWEEVGKIGQPGSQTTQSPAIAAYQGQLYLVCVGRDTSLWWASRDGNGDKVTDWVKIPGTQSDAGLELCVHRGNLYLLHKGLDGKAFYSQTFTDGAWTATTKVVANIGSGLGAASLVDGTMIASYKGDGGSVKYNIFTEGSGWGAQQTVSGAFAKSQPGAASFYGLTLVSYARAAGQKSIAGYVDRP